MLGSLFNALFSRTLGPTSRNMLGIFLSLLFLSTWTKFDWHGCLGQSSKSIVQWTRKTLAPLSISCAKDIDSSRCMLLQGSVTFIDYIPYRVHHSQLYVFSPVSCYSLLMDIDLRFWLHLACNRHDDLPCWSNVIYLYITIFLGLSSDSRTLGLWRESGLFIN